MTLLEVGLGVALVAVAIVAIFFYRKYTEQRSGRTEEKREVELPIVRPIVKTQDALGELKAFEELKANLLSKSDYQMIQGRTFIKKSGWRKLALVFNISDEILDSSKNPKEDGSFVWTFKVRAKAPNGRFTESVASCDSRERAFAHVEHDVQATAHTRAKSRAISDLIAAGEVSAEELDYDDTTMEGQAAVSVQR